MAGLLVRFSHQFGGLMRKPLWTHEVASKVLRPCQNGAQKTTPVVQMDKPICTTASSRAFLIGDEKCGLERVQHQNTMGKHLQIGELLIEKGIINRDQLEIALGEQKRTKEPLGRILLRLGFVENDLQLKLAVTEQIGR